MGFVFSQGLDRVVVHRRRLGSDHVQKENRLSKWSIFFSVLGGIALILLSSLNVLQTSSVS